MRAIMLAILVALTVTGCIHTRTVDFAVPRPEGQIPSGWAQMVGVKVSVADKRIDQTNIGSAITATSNRHRVVIQSSGNLTDAVHQGVVAKLRAHGVSRLEGPAFLLVDSLTTTSLYKVDVEAEAEFMAVVVGADGEVRYRNTYRRKESGMGEALTMDSSKEGAYRLQNVAAGLIQEMIDDDRLIQALIAASRGAKS